MNVTAEGPMRRTKEKSTADFRFPKEGVQPKGFKEGVVNEDVTITIKGTVKRSEDSAEEWSPGKHLRIETKSCIIESAKPATLTKALNSAKRTV